MAGRYRCVHNAVIRSQHDSNSNKVGFLKPRAEINIYRKVRIGASTCLLSDRGWLDVAAPDG